MIFDYPEPREARRHLPANYAAYESYRPWLRDEFDFRCVYCLKRETWGQVTSEFELDHFRATSPPLCARRFDVRGRLDRSVATPRHGSGTLAAPKFLPLTLIPSLSIINA